MKKWVKILLLCVFGCAKSLTTSFDLGGVLSGNRMAGVPLGRSLGSGELDVEGICSETGMACQNCTHAVTCVALPVGWLKVPLQECTDGLYCNAHEGTCSNQVVPECEAIGQKYQHTCEQVGIFPDAFDCRKFHLCSPPEGLPDGRPADHRTALCPRHYGYNPQTAQCSIKLQKGQCTEKPVPDCQTVGQTDALPSSPNHYYVCLVKNGFLYPQVFICPHGWYFWDGFCRPEPQIINTGVHGPSDTDPPDNENFGPGQTDSPSNEHFGPRETDSPSNGNFGPRETESLSNENFRPKETDSPSNGNSGPKDDPSSDGSFISSFEPENRYGPEDRNVGPPNFGPNENTAHHEGNFINEEGECVHTREKPEEAPNKPATTRIEAFFSTDKAVTYPADTFLADKFDLSNYESTDDVAPPMDEFTNSFESGVDFW